MKELLGGKGANLAEMCTIGIPVPPGFTITTEVCATYYENGKRIPESVAPQVESAIRAMEARFGARLGGHGGRARALRARARRAEDPARRPARHRAFGRRPEGAGPSVQGRLQGA